MIALAGVAAIGAYVVMRDAGLGGHTTTTVRRAAANEAVAPCLTPSQCARSLNDLFKQRRFDELALLIAEEGREETVALLRSAAEVLDANQALRQAVEAAYHLPFSGTWDFGAIGDNLGVFSDSLTLLSEKYTGAGAIVTLQEGRHVPLVRARFISRGPRWLLQPEPTPPKLPRQIHGLAETLRDIEGAVRSGIPYLGYVQLFYDRAMPHMQRIVFAPPPSEGAVAAASAAE